MIAIRHITAYNAASIMPVMQRAFDPAYREAWTLAQTREAMLIPGTALLTAGAADAPLGFALARSIFDATELLLLAVDPARQRSGVGRSLIEALIAEGRAIGVRSVFVEVRSDNLARFFYMKSGFVEIGSRKNYYRNATGQYSDAVTMALEIQDKAIADTCTS